MLRFKDILYNEVVLPDWIAPFIKSPEFLRLRGIRLSNIDSYEYKDFNSPTRWEHSIAVAYLASKCANIRGLNHTDSAHLILGGLLHDVVTPPFGHTVEYVLANYDHEEECTRLLEGIPQGYTQPDTPIFASQLPQFRKLCKTVSKSYGIEIDPDTIARLVVGEGDLGFLIRGSIDLDNIDNVIRACLYMGIDVDRQIPIQLVEWLAKSQPTPMSDLKGVNDISVAQWFNYRNKLYMTFFSSSDEELGRQAFLQHIIRLFARSCG